MRCDERNKRSFRGKGIIFAKASNRWRHSVNFQACSLTTLDIYNFQGSCAIVLLFHRKNNILFANIKENSMRTEPMYNLQQAKLVMFWWLSALLYHRVKSEASVKSGVHL